MPLPTEQAVLIREAARLGVDLDHPRAFTLLQLEVLLRDRAVPLGFISEADLLRIRERHVLDSLRAVPHIPSGAKAAYDLGSGAGLPGVPVAVVRPDLRVGLVEARRRRAGFLELVVEELNVPNLEVIVGRAEDLVEGAERVDVCLARAFAPVERAWPVAQRLLRPGGRLIFFAGERPIPTELPDAERILSPSGRNRGVDPEGRIVIIISRS